MKALCNCQSCGEKIEFETHQSGEIVSCQYCGNQTQLSLIIPEKPMDQESFKDGNPAETRLTFIRKNTCYRILRISINVWSLLLIMSAWCFLILPFSYRVQESQTFPGLAPTRRDLIVTIGLCLLALMIILAFRQAALLAVDITDSILHYHARTRRVNF